MPSLSFAKKKAHRTLHTIYIRQRITKIKSSVQRKQWQRNGSVVPSLCVCGCVCISRRIRIIFRNSDTYILWVAERYWNHCMWFPLLPFTFSLPHIYILHTMLSSIVVFVDIPSFGPTIYGTLSWLPKSEKVDP